jgi:hypothetical protein
MKEFTDAIESIASAVEELNVNPTNFFGETTGDVLHDMGWQLERIADALEKIANK